jgi:hypothetical protein
VALGLQDKEVGAAMAEYFTRAEAEALLPHLDPILRELRDLRSQLHGVEQQLEALQVKMRGNGHTHQGELAQLRTAAATHIAAINECVRRVSAYGVLVKDMEMGLVDFPARRQGHEIYLCWRLGEPHVAWWHPIEDGFAGRQPLDE